jgi:hypothetical protein
MKCEKCLQLLEPYFDGELDGRSAALVAAHLEACAACSRDYERLGAEQTLYLLHRCDDEASPVFWDDLLTKVRAEKHASEQSGAVSRRGRLRATLVALAAPRFSPAATAALLLVAVCLTAAILKYTPPRPAAPSAPIHADENRASLALPSQLTENIQSGADARSQQQMLRREIVPEAAVGAQREVKVKSFGQAAGRRGRRSSPAPAVSTETAGAEKLVREAERRYLAAIDILSRDVGRRRTRMDQETRLRFDRTLAVIDRAIAETRGAVREHPRDPAVVQYMLTAYAKKIEVMREMARD